MLALRAPLLHDSALRALRAQRMASGSGAPREPLIPKQGVASDRRPTWRWGDRLDHQGGFVKLGRLLVRQAAKLCKLIG